VLLYQRKCDHDVWMKRSLTNIERAITIASLQASVNKLKSALLVKSVAIRDLNDVNVELRSQLRVSHRGTTIWMSTACVITIMCAWIASAYMP